jgi:hypothetical protein
MRLLKSLNENEARGLLANGVLRLKSGPFTYSLRSREPTLFEGLYRLYADFPLEPEDSFADFHIALVRSISYAAKLISTRRKNGHLTV